MKLKYIAWVGAHDLDQFAVFPETIGHRDFKEFMRLDDEQLFSAGFVSISDDGLHFYGESTSLSINTDEVRMTQLSVMFDGY